MNSNPNAGKQGVVLANESPLLREMLRRAIGKAGGLEVVAEAPGGEGLPRLVARAGASWVIVSLGPDGGMPPAVERVLAEDASVGFVGVDAQGGHAKVCRMAPQEEELGDISLDELIGILQGA